MTTISKMKVDLQLEDGCNTGEDETPAPRDISELSARNGKKTVRVTQDSLQ